VGEALRRVFQALGCKTISHTHLGDWGLQMGLVIAELIDEGFVEDGLFKHPVSMETLNAVYPRASKKAKENDKFRARAANITAELQKYGEPYHGIWRQMRSISLATIKENYRTLGCHFDAFRGESDAEPSIPALIKIMKAHGAHESQGCLVLDVKNETDLAPMPPVILQKQNGGDLYATTDLAALYWRFKHHPADEFIYVTDARQELHFNQVFRAARIGGLVSPETRLTHVAHGSINGADGKPFKTRTGDSIRLEDIINMVTDAAANRMAENMKKAGASGAPSRSAAQKIGLAALKFADLSNTVRKDYIFDIEKASSFNGRTGPYLLYTIARINSIFNKAESAGGIIPPAPPVIGFGGACGAAQGVLSERNTAGVCRLGDAAPAGSSSNYIREIQVAVMRLADSFADAAAALTLNGLADAAYTLAAKFNNLYDNQTIQGHPENLAAANLTRIALAQALSTLAIPTVPKM
jgi:arginyl-tRNA synthetase